MPTISVTKPEIENLLNRTFELEEFSNILFDFGLEIDDVVLENDISTYKIEIPANRYDLLCAEGLNNALQSFLYNKVHADTKIIPSDYKIEKEYFGDRSFIAAAVIKNYKFTQTSYNSFISYQEKLCGSIGRNRSIVAIGTHDFDQISWPVKFKEIQKNKLNFMPLNCNKQVTNLEEHFEHDKKLSKYLKYVGKESYVIFEDSEKSILSVPPVINSEKTKITLDTVNILVEVTGTNIYKVDTCMKMIISAFSTDEVYGVNIVGENGEGIICSNKKYRITVDEVYKELNINLTAKELSDLLVKMMYETNIIDEYTLDITVPTTRQDVIHKVDIIEDIAISYGYNNIKMTIPDINTVGCENPLNKFCNKVRLEMCMLGFAEVYTMVLLSKSDDIFEKESADVENYKSIECEVVRNSLYPGLLKSAAGNLHCKIPIKIFECGDVVRLDGDTSIGAKNQRMLSCLYLGNKSHLEDVQGPMAMILQKCGIENYKFESFDHEVKYLKNQGAVLKIEDEVCGSIGVCNGDLLNKYKLPYSGSMFEIDLEKVFNKFYN